MKILLFSDGSLHALAGAEMVNALALPPGSEVTVLEVAGAPQPANGTLLAAGAERAAALLSRDGVSVNTQVVRDLSPARLRAFTADDAPDLIVVGARGRATAGAGPLRGSPVSLIEQSPAPVLIARAPFNGLSRILLAYDGSPDSRAAVEFLARLPLPADSVITVLNVVTDVPTVEVASVPVGPRLVRSAAPLEVREVPTPEQLWRSNAILSGALETLSRAGHQVRGRVAWGDAAEAILREAGAARADLIVAGSRGLGGVWSWLLGSVSRRLVRAGRRSVLIVRGDVKGWPEA